MSALPNDKATGDQLAATEVNQLRDIGFLITTAGETFAVNPPIPGFIKGSDGKSYKAKSNDTTLSKFDGFIIQSGASSASVAMQTAGRVPGFTGLTKGAMYYVQDTAGTIGTALGTIVIQVGRAVSTTEIQIEKGIEQSSGSFNANEPSTILHTISTTVNHGLGKIPRQIAISSLFTLYITTGTGTKNGRSFALFSGAGSLLNGMSVCEANSSITGFNAGDTVTASGVAQAVISISNVTETSFDLLITYSGGNANSQLSSSTIKWSAIA